MFNCYVVIFAGGPMAYFRTEQAADNFVRMFSEGKFPSPTMLVEGRFVDGIRF